MFDKLFEEMNDWYTAHETYDGWETVVKLNRSEFLALVQEIAKKARDLQ